MDLTFIICFFGIFFVTWSCSADENKGFVDPSDILNFDPVNVRMTVTNKAGTDGETKEISSKGESSSVEDSLNISSTPKENNDNPCHHQLKSKDIALISFFKRFVMTLVQHIESRMSSGLSQEFCMKMRASYEEMLALKYYGTGQTDDVHKVYEKLDKMMLDTTDLPEERGPVYWLEQKLGLSSPVLIQIITILSILIIAAKMLVRTRITWLFIRNCFIIAFMVSTATTYVELYQRKVASQEKILAQEQADRCPHLSESVLSRLAGYFTSSLTFQDENCKEYYEAIIVNPLFQVSLLEAVAVAFVKTLIAPMKIIGNGLKEFLVGLFKDLPLQYSFGLSTVMIVVCLFLPFLVFGYSLKIPFLLTLKPPKKPQLPPSSQQKEKVKEIKCACNKNMQLEDAQTDSSQVSITNKALNASPKLLQENVSKEITPPIPYGRTSDTLQKHDEKTYTHLNMTEDKQDILEKPYTSLKPKDDKLDTPLTHPKADPSSGKPDVLTNLSDETSDIPLKLGHNMPDPTPKSFHEKPDTETATAVQSQQNQMQIQLVTQFSKNGQISEESFKMLPSSENSVTLEVKNSIDSGLEMGNVAPDKGNVVPDEGNVAPDKGNVVPDKESLTSDDLDKTNEVPDKANLAPHEGNVIADMAPVSIQSEVCREESKSFNADFFVAQENRSVDT